MADRIPACNSQNSNGDGPPSSIANDPSMLDTSSDGITMSSSNSPVAVGLFSLLASVMTGFESTAEAASRSQEGLSSAIDRLTGELDKLLEDAPSPFIMQHSARISGIRKRVRALNSLLNSIQRRIDNMDRMLSATSLQVAEVPAIERSGQH